MRFVALAIIIMGFPAFCVWLKQGRRQRLWAYALVGLLPFTLNAWNLDAAVINWAGWPGYAKGAIITMLDALALAIIATHRPPGRATPLLGWWCLYLAAATISILPSEYPQASAFYVFQLVRVIILMVAVARFAPDREALRWLMFGLAAGLIYQAGFAVWQKASGVLQAAGTMGHQNLLGFMALFALLSLLAALLAGERSKLVMLGVLSGCVAVALGASRGSTLFSAIGIALLFVLSLARRPTRRKWRIFGSAVAALALVAPLTYFSLTNRFEQQGSLKGSSDEREAFKRAANAIWSDHPLGVGANTYVIITNTQGYSDRAGVNWSSGRSTNVHNTYLLVAAETGWPGLIAFIGLLTAALFSSLAFAFGNRRDPAGDIALGTSAALIAAAGHNFYEWIFVTYQAQYVFAISVGIVAGLARERRMARRRKPPPSSDLAGLSQLGEWPAMSPLRSATERAPASG